MKTSTLLAAMIAALAILPARADAQQQLRLELQNGLVTLDAQNVPVRQILAEWARVGGARIVNGEKVIGGPVTLQLNGVPERQAIDTILRGVSGYMLASRQADSTGLSGFDRILIMPTSSAPRAAVTPTPGAPPFATRPAPMPVQPQPAVEESEQETFAGDDDHDQEESAGDPEGGAEEDVPPQAQPGMNPRFQRPNPMGGVQVQPFMPQGFPTPPQPVQTDEDTPPGQTPANPFNVPPGATSTPGVISPVPQQEQQPPRPRRPPL